MVDVVLNHRTASKVSPNTNDWTHFVGPDWGEWAIVKVCAPRLPLRDTGLSRHVEPLASRGVLAVTIL